MTEEQHKEEQGGQEVENTTQRPKKNNSFLTSAAIIVAIVLAFVLLRPASAPVEQNDDKQKDTITKEEVKDVMTFEWIATSEWEFTETAEQDIESLTKGQRIEFGIVQDPADENLFYFSTSAFDIENQENLISIYQYRTDNFNFERLFRTTYAEGGTLLLGEQAIPVFHTVGYDNDNLILLVQDTDDSPGPCVQPILLGHNHGDIRNLVSMDINDPYGGFEEYEPSQKVIDYFEKEMRTCQEEM